MDGNKYSDQSYLLQTSDTRPDPVAILRREASLTVPRQQGQEEC